MKKTKIKSAEDFIRLNGKFLGISKWININQDLINHFADATFDHQWIHIDEEKAYKESLTKTTIAHGYLTISLIPYLLNDIIKVYNLKQLINYSIKEIIFKSVVPVNSRLRLIATLKSAKDIGDICKANIFCQFEIEGQEEYALEGTIIYLYYFNN